MKNTTLVLCSTLVVLASVLTSCNNPSAEPDRHISFFEVPLVCGAAPSIGCGSRLKPLFLETAKQSQIKESWSNRQGTVIAIVWNDPAPDQAAQDKVLKSIFEHQDIDAKPVVKEGDVRDLVASLRGKDRWYRGMDVDQLSIEEAGFIAESLTQFARKDGVINEKEAADIKRDIEDYFKKELVKVRTYTDLKSEVTLRQWRKDGYQIYVNHVGKERADSVSALYAAMQQEACKEESGCTEKVEDDCCKKE